MIFINPNMSYLTQEETKTEKDIIQFGNNEEDKPKKKDLLSTISNVYVDLKKTDEEIESLNKSLFQVINKMIDTQKRIKEESILSSKDEDSNQCLPAEEVSSHCSDKNIDKTTEKNDSDINYFRPFIDNDSLPSNSSVPQENNVLMKKNKSACKEFTQSLTSIGVDISHQKNEASPNGNMYFEENPSSQIGYNLTEPEHISVHSTIKSRPNNNDKEIRKVYMKENDSYDSHYINQTAKLAYPLQANLSSRNDNSRIVRYCELGEDEDRIRVGDRRRENNPLSSNITYDGNVGNTSISAQYVSGETAENISSRAEMYYNYYYQKEEGLVYDYSNQIQQPCKQQQEAEYEDKNIFISHENVPHKISCNKNKNMEINIGSSSSTKTNYEIVKTADFENDKSDCSKQLIKDRIEQNIIKRYDEYKKNIVSEVVNICADTHTYIKIDSIQKEPTDVREKGNDEQFPHNIDAPAKMTYGEYRKFKSSRKHGNPKESHKEIFQTDIKQITKMESLKHLSKSSVEMVSGNKHSSHRTDTRRNVYERNPDKIVTPAINKSKIQDICEKKAGMYSKYRNEHQRIIHKKEIPESGIDRNTTNKPSFKEQYSSKSDSMRDDKQSRIGICRDDASNMSEHKEKYEALSRRWDPSKSRYGRKPGTDNNLPVEPSSNPFNPFNPKENTDKPLKVRSFGKERDPSSTLLAKLKVGESQKDSKIRKCNIAKASATSTEDDKPKEKSSIQNFMKKEGKKTDKLYEDDIISEPVVSSTNDDIDLRSTCKNNIALNENTICQTSEETEKVEEGSDKNVEIEKDSNDSKTNSEKVKSTKDLEETSPSVGYNRNIDLEEKVIEPNQSKNLIVLDDLKGNKTIHSSNDKKIDEFCLFDQHSATDANEKVATKDYNSEITSSEHEEKLPTGKSDHESSELNKSLTLSENSKESYQSLAPPVISDELRVCKVRLIDLFWKEKKNGKFKPKRICRLVHKFMKRLRHSKKRQIQVYSNSAQNPVDLKEENNTVSLLLESDDSKAETVKNKDQIECSEAVTEKEFQDDKLEGIKERNKRILSSDNKTLDTNSTDAVCDLNAQFILKDVEVENRRNLDESTETKTFSGSDEKVVSDTIKNDNGLSSDLLSNVAEVKCSDTKEIKSSYENENGVPVLVDLRESAKNVDLAIIKINQDDAYSAGNDISSEKLANCGSITADSSQKNDSFENKLEVITGNPLITTTLETIRTDIENNDVSTVNIVSEDEHDKGVSETDSSKQTGNHNNFLLNERNGHMSNQTANDVICDTLNVVEESNENYLGNKVHNVSQVDVSKVVDDKYTETTEIMSELSHSQNSSSNLTHDTLREDVLTQSARVSTITSPSGVESQTTLRNVSLTCDEFDKTTYSEDFTGTADEDNQNISCSVDIQNSNDQIDPILEENKISLSIPLPMIDNISSEIDRSLRELENTPNTLLEDSSDSSENNDVPFLKNLDSFLTDLSKISGKTDEDVSLGAFSSQTDNLSKYNTKPFIVTENLETTFSDSLKQEISLNITEEDSKKQECITHDDFSTFTQNKMDKTLGNDHPFSSYHADKKDRLSTLDEVPTEKPVESCQTCYYSKQDISNKVDLKVKEIQIGSNLDKSALPDKADEAYNKFNDQEKGYIDVVDNLINSKTATVDDINVFSKPFTEGGDKELLRSSEVDARVESEKSTLLSKSNDEATENLMPGHEFVAQEKSESNICIYEERKGEPKPKAADEKENNVKAFERIKLINKDKKEFLQFEEASNASTIRETEICTPSGSVVLEETKQLRSEKPEESLSLNKQSGTPKNELTTKDYEMSNRLDTDIGLAVDENDRNETTEFFIQEKENTKRFLSIGDSFNTAKETEITEKQKKSKTVGLSNVAEARKLIDTHKQHKVWDIRIVLIDIYSSKTTKIIAQEKNTPLLGTDMHSVKNKGDDRSENQVDIEKKSKLHKGKGTSSKSKRKLDEVNSANELDGSSKDIKVNLTKRLKSKSFLTNKRPIDIDKRYDSGKETDNVRKSIDTDAKFDLDVKKHKAYSRKISKSQLLRKIQSHTSDSDEDLSDYNKRKTYKKTKEDRKSEKQLTSDKESDVDSNKLNLESDNSTKSVILRKRKRFSGVDLNSTDSEEEVEQKESKGQRKCMKVKNEINSAGKSEHDNNLKADSTKTLKSKTFRRKNKRVLDMDEQSDPEKEIENIIKSTDTNEISDLDDRKQKDNSRKISKSKLFRKVQAHISNSDEDSSACKKVKTYKETKEDRISEKQLYSDKESDVDCEKPKLEIDSSTKSVILQKKKRSSGTHLLYSSSSEEEKDKEESKRPPKFMKKINEIDSAGESAVDNLKPDSTKTLKSKIFRRKNKRVLDMSEQSDPGKEIGNIKKSTDTGVISDSDDKKQKDNSCKISKSKLFRKVQAHISDSDEDSSACKKVKTYKETKENQISERQLYSDKESDVDCEKPKLEIDSSTKSVILQKKKRFSVTDIYSSDSEEEIEKEESKGQPNCKNIINELDTAGETGVDNLNPDSTKTLKSKTFQRKSKYILDSDEQSGRGKEMELAKIVINTDIVSDFRVGKKRARPSKSSNLMPLGKVQKCSSDGDEGFSVSEKDAAHNETINDSRSEEELDGDNESNECSKKRKLECENVSKSVMSQKKCSSDSISSCTAKEIKEKSIDNIPLSRDTTNKTDVDEINIKLHSNKTSKLTSFRKEKECVSDNDHSDPETDRRQIEKFTYNKTVPGLETTIDSVNEADNLSIIDVKKSNLSSDSENDSKILKKKQKFSCVIEMKTDIKSSNYDEINSDLDSKISVGKTKKSACNINDNSSDNSSQISETDISANVSREKIPSAGIGIKLSMKRKDNDNEKKEVKNTDLDEILSKPSCSNEKSIDKSLSNFNIFFKCVHCRNEYCTDVEKGKSLDNYSKNILSFCETCYIKIYKHRFISFKKKFNP